MDQPSLYDAGVDAVVEDRRLDDRDANTVQQVIASESEVRELAREYLKLPPPLVVVESPLLKRKRRLRATAEHDAGRRGLVATWSREAFSFISIHDPVEGEWHDVPVSTAPRWARWEARKRKELYKAGDRRAYDRMATEMEEIWREEHPPDPDYIVEDHPLE